MELPAALDPLLPAARPRRGLCAAVGPRCLPAWLLTALCPWLGRGGGLFWIDAGTGFDAYGLGRAARAAGVDPKEALARVRLARPFNAFQLETILREKLPALWRGEPVVLSDPLVPFIDEDLSQEDYRRLLPRVLGALERLPALWLLLAVRRPEPAGRAGTLAAFLRRARSVAVLEETDEGGRLIPR